jgi:hypothetical protein
LLERFGLQADRGLTAIGQIVHDIDLRDDRFSRAETSGIEMVIAGIAAAHKRDTDRIEAGSAVLDALYSQLSRS